MVHYQCPKNRGLGISDLEAHWFVGRLAYLGWCLSKGMAWRQKVRKTIPRFMSDPKAKGRHKRRSEAPFARECCQALCNLPGSSDLSRSWKQLYQELLVASTSDPLMDRLGWSMEEVRSHWNWAPGSSFLNNSEFSLTWQLAPNALLLLSLNYRACLADLSDCPCCGSGIEEMAEHAFYNCEWVHPFWDHVGE